MGKAVNAAKFMCAATLAICLGVGPASAASFLQGASAATGALPFALLANGIDPVRLQVSPYRQTSERFVNPETERAIRTSDLKRLELPPLPGTEQARPPGPPIPRRKPPVPVVVAGEPPPPTSIGAAAGLYRRFHGDIASIAAMRLDSPKNLKKAEQLLTAYTEASLARGWIAYSAEVASRAPSFAEGVKQAMGASSAETLLSSWRDQPFSALDIKGADEASRQILKAANADAAYLQTVAVRLNDIAYGRASDEPSLAAAAKGRPVPAAQSAPPAEAPAGSLNMKAKPLLAQMLALGASLSLEAATGKPAEGAPAIPADKDATQCLKWARLNLDQCLAAAQIPSERAYCLAKHGIDERAKCWSWIADPTATP